jgi:hypothetical protein
MQFSLVLFQKKEKIDMKEIIYCISVIVFASFTLFEANCLEEENMEPTVCEEDPIVGRKSCFQLGLEEEEEERVE